MTTEQVVTAAYLGYQPARELLGPQAPAEFSLQSMLLGGDRRWRTAMRFLGHEAVAFAACEIAEVALAAYLKAPDASPPVLTLARDAVRSLSAWKLDPRSEISRSEVMDVAGKFCLAVDIGGELYDETGCYGRQLGQVVGRCYSVVVAADNPRYVRWLGEAAEATCRHLGVTEATICTCVANAMLPVVFGRNQQN